MHPPPGAALKLTTFLFKLCFWQFKLWHHFSPWLYRILLYFFRLLDRKFNEDSKNVLKTVTFSLQVGFTGGFIPDCFFKLFFWRSVFDTTFLLDCTKFCSIFSDYWIGNLLRIPKMCLKQSLFHSKWILQAILSLTVFLNCLSDVQSLTPLFSLTVPNFVVLFQVIG